MSLLNKKSKDLKTKMKSASGAVHNSKESSKLDGTSSERWGTMIRVALGQGKMFTRPIAAIFHLFLYVGFVIINIEVVEIVLDGILGQHRLFHGIGALCKIWTCY